MQHAVLCGTSALTERGLEPHQTPLPPYPCSDHLSEPLGFSLSALPPFHIYLCSVLPRDRAKRTIHLPVFLLLLPTVGGNHTTAFISGSRSV